MDYAVEDFDAIATRLNQLQAEKKEMLERIPVDTPVRVYHDTSIINYDPLSGNWAYQRSS